MANPKKRAKALAVAPAPAPAPSEPAPEDPAPAEAQEDEQQDGLQREPAATPAEAEVFPYEVLTPLRTNGEKFGVGTVVGLTAAEAMPWEACGAVRRVPEPAAD